jgi:hypothetical protein
MVRHIAHMYELQKFMASLATAASRRPHTPFTTVDFPPIADKYAPVRREEVFKPLDMEQINVAAKRLGVSLPPLAGDH